CAPRAWHPGGPSSACADCRCQRCAPSALDPASPPPPTRSSQSDRWSRPPGRSWLPEEVESANRASSPECCPCSATCSVSHRGVEPPKCIAACEHRRQSLSSFCLLEKFPFFCQAQFTLGPRRHRCFITSRHDFYAVESVKSPRHKTRAPFAALR